MILEISGTFAPRGQGFIYPCVVFVSMTKELKTIEVFAEDYERYMAFCEKYDTITPTNFLGIMLNWLNIPSAEEIRKNR